MCHREDPERSEEDRSDLKNSEIATFLSVARNDNLAADGAYYDFLRAKRIPLALRSFGTPQDRSASTGLSAGFETARQHNAS
jgi:hypothetical protein